MRKLLVLAVSAAAVFSTCQAQAAHRHRRLVKVRTESRPPEGPLWYYSRPTPLGAIRGKQCYSRLVENRLGWYVPHQWCEARR